MSYFVSTIINLNVEIIKTTLSGISKYPSSLLIYFFSCQILFKLLKDKTYKTYKNSKMTSRLKKFSGKKNILVMATFPPALSADNFYLA